MRDGRGLLTEEKNFYAIRNKEMSNKAKKQNASNAAFFNEEDRKQLNEIYGLMKEMKAEMSDLKLLYN